MLCPVCGAAELVHGIHATPYSCKGRTTSFQLEGDCCPACGEVVLAKPECHRLDALMVAFAHSVNGEPCPDSGGTASGNLPSGAAPSLTQEVS